MTRLLRLEDIKTKAALSILEYKHRERLAGHSDPINWDDYNKWCNNYYNGYMAEKYIYDHCPEVKPIDPDWEYLCHMEHFGSHTYDCTYKGVSADIKSCWLNGAPKNPKYIYVKTNNKSVNNLMHGASLVISRIGDNIAYAFTTIYSTCKIYGVEYYRFPIEAYIYKTNTV